MTGCALRTFFIGYFHFLPLAKIPPVMINNSIPLSGYYYYFQQQAAAGSEPVSSAESQMLCAYLLTILWAETLSIPTSPLVLFHPNGVPWNHSQWKETGQTEAKVQTDSVDFACRVRIYTYFSDVRRQLTCSTRKFNDNTNPPLF